MLEYFFISLFVLFANALPLLQIMSMDIALAPPPSPVQQGSLASRWVLRDHGLPAEALADRLSARPSPLLAWRSLCLCPTLKVCACPPIPLTSNQPSLPISACILPPWAMWIKTRYIKLMLMQVCDRRM